MVKGTGKLRAGGMPEHEAVAADARVRNRGQEPVRHHATKPDSITIGTMRSRGDAVTGPTATPRWPLVTC